jgi:hypothetical protein
LLIKKGRQITICKNPVPVPEAGSKSSLEDETTSNKDQSDNLKKKKPEKPKFIRLQKTSEEFMRLYGL